MQKNIFDYLKSLTENKIDLSNDDDFEKNYLPYMINKFLSMHPKTIFYAHFMNKVNIDKKHHYLFLFNVLEQEKIFFKYQKKEKSIDIKLIKKCFDVSDEKAKEYYGILTSKQLKTIEKKYGGKK